MGNITMLIGWIIRELKIYRNAQHIVSPSSNDAWLNGERCFALCMQHVCVCVARSTCVLHACVCGCLNENESPCWKYADFEAFDYIYCVWKANVNLDYYSPHTRTNDLRIHLRTHFGCYQRWHIALSSLLSAECYNNCSIFILSVLPRKSFVFSRMFPLSLSLVSASASTSCVECVCVWQRWIFAILTTVPRNTCNVCNQH